MSNHCLIIYQEQMQANKEADFPPTKLSLKVFSIGRYKLEHIFLDVSTMPPTIKISDKMYFKTSFVDCGYVYPVNFPGPEEED